MRIIIASTGASGQLFFVKLLQVLKDFNDIETHVIVSRWGVWTLEHETEMRYEELSHLTSNLYDVNDLSQSLASGSSLIDGMIILPCSMKTLSAIATGYSDSLITRSADVALKEQKKLILCPRETPLHEIHLENMLRLRRMGVMMMPIMPAFYGKPETIEDIVNHFVGRILDHFCISNDYVKRWKYK